MMRSLYDKLRFLKSAEFGYCREDILYFVTKYCFFEDKDSERVVVPFCPWKEQKDALLSIKENRYNLFLKARQTGVTWIVLMYCVWDLVFNPGHTVIALSKSGNDATELVRRFGIIISNMQSLLEGGDKRFEIKKKEVLIYSSDGSPSVFKSFAAARSSGRSFTANILFIDEWAFQEWAREIWLSAYPTVNRPTGGKVIGVSTIKRGTLFEELWTSQNNFKKTFISVFADPARDAVWYERTKTDLGEQVRQEYPRSADEALADAGGRFFYEFDISKHVCEPFEIPKDWQIYSTMDYGLDMLAHYKVAVDSCGCCYVFHEIYKQGLIVSEAAEKIHMADGYNGESWKLPVCRLAPPDLFARELSSGKSQAYAFEENGIRLTKSSNDRKAGWMYLKELLRCRLAPDGTLKPSLRIFSVCRNLIRAMQNILVDEKDPSDCAREPHELTHAPDALRYFAVYWYKPAEIKKENDKRSDWTADMWEDYYSASDSDREYLKNKWNL